MNFFETTITEYAQSNAIEVLMSGFLSEGKWVDNFEKGVEQVFGYKNCVAVNSCTSALHLALILAGVKPGDEVILPAQTFVATGLAVLYCGAKPVFADIERETGNIEPWYLEKKATEKTKAIISVSWGGTPPHLEELEALGRALGIAVIQDNAHALGSTYASQPIANFGDFSCFSFQAIKSLTTGDGGMLTCKSDHDYYRAKKLRWFGIDRENDKVGFDGERVYDAHEVGYKYHMNNIAAAIGLGNLHGVHERQARRKEIADYYDKHFNLPWATLVSREGSSDWLYTILVEERDKFITAMRSKDIPVSVVHNGIDRNSIFGGIDRSLVNQRYWDEHHICLPCHSGLTDEDVSKVVQAVQGGW